MEDTLEELTNSRTAALIADTSDIVFVIDPDGIVIDFADSGSVSRERFAESPRHRHWADLVTVESRPKVAEMLEAARSGDAFRWRHINLLGSRDTDIPVSFKAVDVNCTGTIVAVGRDMSPMAAIQQRLVEAQITLEREAARVRHAETRYQILFRNAGEAILTLDPETETVIEANESAAAVLGKTAGTLAKAGLDAAFDEFDPVLVRALVAKARLEANRDIADVLRAPDGRRLLASARYVSVAPASFVLLRITAPEGGGSSPGSSRTAIFDRLFDAVPDAFVVTDERGRVIRANSSFRSMAQLSSEDQARGRTLDRWLGRSGADLNVFLSNVRRHGRLHNFATAVTGEMEGRTNVEISSASVKGPDGTALVLVIRNVDQRLLPESAAGKAPQSSDRLVELIGKLTLKQIVQQTTDEIERLCIQSALLLTGENRASAAKLLGLSRQGFYVKLKRYGFGDK